MRELLCRDSHSRWGDVTDSNDPNQCQNRIVMRIRLLEEFSSLAKMFLLYYAVYHIGSSVREPSVRQMQCIGQNSLSNLWIDLLVEKKGLEMCSRDGEGTLCLVGTISYSLIY